MTIKKLLTEPNTREILSSNYRWETRDYIYVPKIRDIFFDDLIGYYLDPNDSLNTFTDGLESKINKYTAYKVPWNDRSRHIWEGRISLDSIAKENPLDQWATITLSKSIKGKVVRFYDVSWVMFNTLFIPNEIPKEGLYLDTYTGRGIVRSDVFSIVEENFDNYRIWINPTGTEIRVSNFLDSPFRSGSHIGTTLRRLIIIRDYRYTLNN